MINSFHVPVLVEAVLQFLITEPGGIYVDGTLGGGGHAESVMNRLSNSGQLIGFDEDAEAIESAKNKLSRFQPRVHFCQNNFSNIKSEIRQVGFEKINGIIFDLGISSHQIDDRMRGFSYQSDGPLDMRMNTKQKISASDVVNSYSRERLIKIFREYGEERFSSRIANKIIEMRNEKKIETTKELAAIVELCISGKFLQKSIARIFQAIRIDVNNELENLRKGLTDAIGILQPGGRIVVLSYHSLEDRIVKDTFRSASQKSVPSGNKFLPDKIQTPMLKLIVKKPIEPEEKEIIQNPRARSAKMRVAERV
ncbi:MAG: 16S rRNA (cytosine(1402)-N(4))-methyltransferase RsmH [Ignavibacteriales bacterium]|nr:16S rRNA (cytosine(1402)-N(4))-methyltransferase RsmH [Ignavibacteriales bacterium]